MGRDVFECQERSIISPISQMATPRPRRIKLAKSPCLGEGRRERMEVGRKEQRGGESGRMGDRALKRLCAESRPP